MPPLSTKTKHYHRERIRSLIVQNPHISAEGIRKALDLQGLTLDRHYISKLLGAIHTERAKRADTWTLNMALAAFQDAMGEIVRVGWEIANDKFAPVRDRAAALREMREAYDAMFERLFDAGVFEKKLGSLDLAGTGTSPVPPRSRSDQGKILPTGARRSFATCL